VGSPSPRGTYLDIAKALRDEIEGGTYVDGAALPSESALVQRFNVARETVRRGLAVLQGEGLVSKAQGKGWFVGREPAQLPAKLSSILTALRDAIANDFGDGDRFRSEKDLIEEYDISRHQARQVLSALESAGLLVTQPGKGRFVRAVSKGPANA
jgi:DNA-binding GntR family transcriptional regulator